MPAPSKKKQPVRNAAPPPPPQSPAIPAGLKMLAALCLLVAIAAAFMLALDHFALVTPPGCGPQSDCHRATRSQWGTIPVVNWPTSLAGVAYFSAMLAAWLASSRSIHSLLRGIAWLGVLGSLFFTTVMLTQGYVCKYCLATHIANFAFLIVMEIAARRVPTVARASRPGESVSVSAREISLTPVVAGLVAFLIATSALAITHQQTTARRLARSESELRSSTDEIARRSAANAQTNTTTSPSDATQAAVGPPNPADMGPPRPPGPDTPSNSNANTNAGTVTIGPRPNTDVSSANPTQKPFTGRYRLGPDNAPIRVVMFMDYQCEDCQLMESQAAALLQRRSDVSLSVKQFPMCADCNPHIGGMRMHLNACWAARAAEAAGMLQGNDGFWKMHNWLFQRRGSFTDADFPPALQALGFEPNTFIQTMTSNATLQNVLADAAEGADLGLHFTPLIFINGVELRGFIGNPGALTRAVEDLASRNLPPGSAANDHPAKAAEKFVADWQAQPARNIPPSSRPRALGNANVGTGKVVITVFGDLQDSFTAELDGAIQSLIKAGKDVRYDFRTYPASNACNPNVQRVVYPSSCIAAKAAEAAATVGGYRAYWDMHTWLLAHLETPEPWTQAGQPAPPTPAPTLTDGVLRKAATECGLDPAALLAAMNAPEVAAAIAADVSTGGGGGLVINGQIPTVYINGKWLPRWKLQGTNILERIVEAAARGN